MKSSLCHIIVWIMPAYVFWILSCLATRKTTWYAARHPQWLKFLDQHNPSALLLENNTALRQLALAAGTWKPVHVAPKYSVLAPDNLQHANRKKMK
jgi:hypothetical protein